MLEIAIPRDYAAIVPLFEDEIRMALRDLPGWRAFGNALHKQFTFRGFRAAIAFINRVAEQAIAVGHHPDIENHYNRVMLSLTSHDQGGITEKDIALAHAIERVAEPAARAGDRDDPPAASREGTASTGESTPG
jgi:4a-hydroxytetrahydrobiopterin dehydratase